MRDICSRIHEPEKLHATAAVDCDMRTHPSIISQSRGSAAVMLFSLSYKSVRPPENVHKQSYLDIGPSLAQQNSGYREKSNPRNVYPFTAFQNEARQIKRWIEVSSPESAWKEIFFLSDLIGIGGYAFLFRTHRRLSLLEVYVQLLPCIGCTTI